MHLFERRTIWLPTLWGWASLAAVAGALGALGWLQGESFLSLTDRQPAEALVVESWIGIDGLQAAKAEFERGGYRYLITVGGQRDDRWYRTKWNYADAAADVFVREGMPADQVIASPSSGVKERRTFEDAITLQRTLQSRKLQLKAINVFTLGAHARRSRLVFAKVLRPEIDVGVISWVRSDDQVGPWWRSSERADYLIKEWVGYLFEAIFNSGRSSNSVAEHSNVTASAKAQPSRSAF